VNPGLFGLRVGCVEYLNAKPLIFGYERYALFDHPAALAGLLSLGKLDVALVPVYELLSHPEYLVVDGICIGSCGPVFSVFMAYLGELKNVRTVMLDSASLTSNQLLLCLLQEFEQLRVTPTTGPADGRLLIGNQALSFRRKHGDAYSYFDLGEQWTRHTGLPFVYAVWLISPAVADPEVVANRFRAIGEQGTANFGAISAGEPDPAFAQWYLRNCLRYEMGEAEKLGIARFSALLEKCGSIAQAPKELRFV
jgi:chorismate dehydratase